MDIVSILYAVLFIIVVILLLMISAHATIIAILYGVISIVAILLVLFLILRYSRQIRPTPIVESIQHPLPPIGGLCEVLDEISPAKPGFVRYRGELWKAFSVHSTFKKGDHAYVVDIRGRFLIIEREPIIRPKIKQ